MPEELMRAILIDDLTPTYVAPGITRRDLPATDRASGWVIDFEPGTEWPDVDHHHDEERYLVVSGEIIEGKKRYPAGSYVIFSPGSRHRPRSDSGGRIVGINIAI
jgi:quercetin dioxygenase-like cupin family protein